MRWFGVHNNNATQRHGSRCRAERSQRPNGRDFTEKRNPYITTQTLPCDGIGLCIPGLPVGVTCKHGRPAGEHGLPLPFASLRLIQGLRYAFTSLLTDVILTPGLSAGEGR